jgi:transaldolase
MPMKILDIVSEKEIKEALLAEYEKKIILYKLTDERLKKKYEMSFNEFEEKNIVKEKDFSWEVEKDAMDWEHAVEGIRHLQEKIDKIKEADNGY